VEALFQDGITTKKTVSELSDEVSDVCGAVGLPRSRGQVTLSSEAGKGTRLRFVVPLEATGRELRSGRRDGVGTASVWPFVARLIRLARRAAWQVKAD